MSGVWRAQAGAVFGYLALHCVLGNRVSRPFPVHDGQLHAQLMACISCCFPVIMHL